MPNRSRRSPDSCWVRLKRWTLTPEEQDKTAFLLPSDLSNQRDKDLQEKMQEYLNNGVRLGWLIEPKAQTVEIYRSGQAVEVLQGSNFSSEDVLPGFMLDLKPIWSGGNELPAAQLVAKGERTLHFPNKLYY